MNFDFIGAEQNLVTLAGSQTVHMLDFVDSKGAPIDLSGVTFDGVVTLPDGSTQNLDITQDEISNVLLVFFPQLEGITSYRYEIRAVAESGEPMRILHGKVGVMDTALDLARVGDSQPERRLLVQLPDEEVRHLMLRWRASGVAEAAALQASAAAKQAQSAIDDVTAAADEAKKAAEDARQAAQNAADDALGEIRKLEEEANRKYEEWEGKVGGLMEQVEQTRKKADATVERLEGFMVNWEDKIRSVIWVDPATDHLIIGGVDTMVKVSGDPGKSPYVDERGHWMYYDDNTEQWLDGGSARGDDGFSPYVDELGRIVYRDPLTGEIITGKNVIGKDGRDGTSVVRHLLDYDGQLPTLEDNPELCNGGHIFYIPATSYEARARIDVLEEARAEGDSLSINSMEVALPDTELSAEEAAGELAAAIDELPDISAENEGSAVHIVTRGTQLVVALQHNGGYDVTEYPYIRRSGYDIYAWVQRSENASGEWARVDEAYDIATMDVYGLSKLGTNETVEDGAVVGHNAEGQLHVPTLSYTVKGTAMTSCTFGLAAESSGLVGKDAEGRLYAQAASVGTYGVVKPGFNGVDLCNVVGIMADGTLGLPKASLYQWGLVKLGSRFGQSNPIPYQQGVGMTEDGNLANNLLYGGALQHMGPAGWVARGMEWLDERMTSDPQFFGDMYYLGLVTSEQFDQSPEIGLFLKSATTSMLGGVYIARDVNDDRTNAIVWPGLMTQYTYSKKTLDDKLDLKWNKSEGEKYVETKVGNLSSNINKTLEKYATQAWVKEYSYKKSEIDGLLAKKLNTSSNVQQIETVSKTTAASMQSISQRNKTTLYIEYEPQ